MSIHSTLVFQVTNPSSPPGFVLFFLLPSSSPPPLVPLFSSHSQSRARVPCSPPMYPTVFVRVSVPLLRANLLSSMPLFRAVGGGWARGDLLLRFVLFATRLPLSPPSPSSSSSSVRLTKLRLRRPNQRGNYVNCNYRVATPSSRSLGKLIPDNFVPDRQRLPLFVANRIEIFVNVVNAFS